MRERSESTTVGHQCHKWPLTLACGYGRSTPSNRYLSSVAGKRGSDGAGTSSDSDDYAALAIIAATQGGACGACGGGGACGACGVRLESVFNERFVDGRASASKTDSILGMRRVRLLWRLRRLRRLRWLRLTVCWYRYIYKVVL